MSNSHLVFVMTVEVVANMIKSKRGDNFLKFNRFSKE